MTRNKTTLLLKGTFGRSIHVREVLFVPARIKTHSIHGSLRIEVPYDVKARLIQWILLLQEFDLEIGTRKVW